MARCFFYFAGLILTGLILVTVPARANSWAGSWDEAAARSQADDAVTRPVTRNLLDLTPFLDLASLQTRLQEVLNDPSLPLAARERAVRDYAFELRTRDPDAVAWQALEDLSHHAAAVRVAHPESRGGHTVPLFDIARAARGTINQWTRISAERTAQRAIANGDLETLGRLAASDHRQQQAGAAEALRSLPIRRLQYLAPALSARLAEEPHWTVLVKAAGERLGDPALLIQVIEQGRSPAREQTLRDLDRWLRADQAASIWRRMATRAEPSLAALSVARLGAVEGHQPETRQFLLDQLSHPKTGSAAALALSKLGADEVSGQLAKVLATGDPMSQRRARLALELSAGPLAGELLRRHDQELQR